MPVTPELSSSIAGALRELERIPQDRRERLRGVADFVSGRVADSGQARLMFICTHNSRRSQMAQIWAQTAAHHVGVDGVETYSGGTEATAFDPRAVAALERAGFRIETSSTGENPVYVVRYGAAGESIECFSKVFSDAPNPAADFAAVMTCSAADAACPLVAGASERFSLPYDDPKDFDGSSRELEAYDASCRRIAREMLYALSLVRR